MRVNHVQYSHSSSESGLLTGLKWKQLIPDEFLESLGCYQFGNTLNSRSVTGTLLGSRGDINVNETVFLLLRT